MNIDKKLSEIKEYRIKAEIALDEKFPEFCDEYELAVEELANEVRNMELEAYKEWENTPEYAAFKTKQAQNLRNRYYA